MAVLAINEHMGGPYCSINVDMPSWHLSPGLPNTDLIVYLTDVDNSQEDYLATSGYCAL